MKLETVSAVLNAAIRVVSAKIVAFVALFMTFGLFCAAMYLGTWIAYTLAGTFGVTIFLPSLFRQAGDSHGQE